jgi:hypothetical protein
MDLKKDGGKDDQKALSATGSAGRTLTPESLEGTAKDQDYGGGCACDSGKPCKGCKSCKKRKKRKDHSTAKSLTFIQCVDLLQSQRGLSAQDATVVTETVFEMNEIPI